MTKDETVARLDDLVSEGALVKREDCKYDFSDQAKAHLAPLIDKNRPSWLDEGVGQCINPDCGYETIEGQLCDLCQADGIDHAALGVNRPTLE